MIEVDKKVFHLRAAAFSYLFEVNEGGQIEHLYFGDPVTLEDAEALRYQRTMPYGSSVMLKDDSSYSLDNLPLEWSGSGKGDYRTSPLEVVWPDGSFTTDFEYDSHEWRPDIIEADGLPIAHAGKAGAEANDVESLLIHLKDGFGKLKLTLIYTLFPKVNVLTRRVWMENLDEETIELRKVMSQMIDLPEDKYEVLGLAGDWISESHAYRQVLEQGAWSHGSHTGNSSNRHNPGFILMEAGAREDRGRVYGFNLVYSGSHFAQVERSSRGFFRVMNGIQPQDFSWRLQAGERFESPEAVLTYSAAGLNGASQNFHQFVREHILRGYWQEKVRPILLNNWEAHFFDFNERKLVDLAKKAKDLGVELFVLDDGWFGERNDDHAGLGDYDVNKVKLPQGLKGLSMKIHEMGLDFGLWVEPESVNPKSKLFSEHPEYAIRVPGRLPAMGRHQLLLDLTQKAVRDYLVTELSRVFDEAKVDYVKWDMNRHMSDMYSADFPAGEFVHRYILGLYEVMERVFGPRPHILLESCSSGGNRFDLGMLCYSPQIWASDDTDPIERVKIQSGLSYFYPPVTMGAHLSQAPHQQTLRQTSLSLRFNVAAFGAFGFELDLADLSSLEWQEAKAMVEFYKEYRKIFQLACFSRVEQFKENKYQWQVLSEDRRTGLVLLLQDQCKAGESNDRLRVKGLLPGERYRLKALPQKIDITRFGGLVKHALPINLGSSKSLILNLISRHKGLEDGPFEVEASAAALAAGIYLNNQFIGTGYQSDLRLWGDFASQLYLLECIEQ